MIDIHCHVLPQIDDGPSTIEESVALCQIAAENHIEKIAATPHFHDFEKIDRFLDKRRHRIELVAGELARFDLDIEIYPGAEVFITDDIFYFDGLEKLTINNSRYLLVEFPYSGLNLNIISKYISEIRQHGLIPIIAHPERYDYFQREYELLNILADHGVLFQVNADSIFSPVSKKEFKLARAMLTSGIASFLATDAHSVQRRPNNLFEMISTFPEDLNTIDLDKMVNVNPKAVILNMDADLDGSNRL